MLDTLTREDFAKHLNQRFQVRRDAGDLALELIEAAGLGGDTPRAEDERVPFSLVFRGPKEAPLQQMMYQVDHPAMGALDLFLVPIGLDEEGMLYEAVFN